MKKLKSIRIDEEFLEKVEEVRKLYKKTCKFSFTTSELLENMMIEGMEHYISILKLITNNEAYDYDENGNKVNIKFDKDLINEIKNLESWYFDFLYEKENE